MRRPSPRSAERQMLEARARQAAAGAPAGLSWPEEPKSGNTTSGDDHKNGLPRPQDEQNRPARPALTWPFPRIDPDNDESAGKPAARAAAGASKAPPGSKRKLELTSVNSRTHKWNNPY